MHDSHVIDFNRALSLWVFSAKKWGLSMNILANWWDGPSRSSWVPFADLMVCMTSANTTCKERIDSIDWNQQPNSICTIYWTHISNDCNISPIAICWFCWSNQETQCMSMNWIYQNVRYAISHSIFWVVEPPHTSFVSEVSAYSVSALGLLKPLPCEFSNR